MNLATVFRTTEFILLCKAGKIYLKLVKCSFLYNMTYYQEYYQRIQEETTLTTEEKFALVSCISRMELWQLPVILDLQQFCHITGSNKGLLNYALYQKHLHYKIAKIPKKNGNVRELQIPSVSLREVQKWILDHILTKVPCSEYAMGFKSGISIVDNAKPHVGKHCVINLDIKDFFPSISYGRVYQQFKSIGYSKTVSSFLANLCTYSKTLPQGAPTSPYLSNLICRDLDYRLGGYAKSINAAYSRYADDITFSSDKSIVFALANLKSIIQQEGFTVNETKTRTQFHQMHQEVTGLIVNEKVNVSKYMRRKIRQELYYCRKFGVSGHLKKLNIQKHHYKEHIYGQVHFIKMVDIELGRKLYQQLKEIDWES